VTEAVRDYGYSPVGQRCEGTRNWGARGRVNAIGALVKGKLKAVGLIEGTVNSAVFLVWLTQILLPVLSPASVVVMDNASFHKRAEIQLALKAAGHTLHYLPPYSPDLNPIEHKWAQAKALRRRHRCDVDTLFREYLL